MIQSLKLVRLQSPKFILALGLGKGGRGLFLDCNTEFKTGKWHVPFFVGGGRGRGFFDSDPESKTAECTMRGP